MEALSSPSYRFDGIGKVQAFAFWRDALTARLKSIKDHRSGDKEYTCRNVTDGLTVDASSVIDKKLKDVYLTTVSK